jgi:hypothetical protein
MALQPVKEEYLQVDDLEDAFLMRNDNEHSYLKVTVKIFNAEFRKSAFAQKRILQGA